MKTTSKNLCWILKVNCGGNIATPPISDVFAFLTKCICNLILRPFFANNPIIEKFPKKNIQYLDIFAREANLERFVRKYMQLEDEMVILRNAHVKIART